MYAAIDVETKLLLDIAVFNRHGTDPAAAFLHGLTEKHDVENAVFLFDGHGYLTALSRLGLGGRPDYSTRTLLEKWVHTLKMRTDRFYTSWVGSRAVVMWWLHQFQHYYNHHRPHQSLDGNTPTEVI